ncbi:MAG: DUF2946 domain-containing protein [Pseudomonadota bacterium]|nr:DUF2946 domain-containing protein [Pseudomonadota bacterium]
MHRIARHLTAYAWIAALAILFNALAPVVSQARAQGVGRAATVEICTAMGVAMVALPDAGNTSDSSDPGHLLKGMSHCAYCATHAGSFGLPPQALQTVAVQRGHDGFPPLFYQSPATLFTWSRAHARAPPASA